MSKSLNSKCLITSMDLIKKINWRDILVASTLLIVFDTFYLMSMKKYLANQVAKVQKHSVNVRMAGVAACYLLLVACLYGFVLHSSINPSVTNAFLLGICVYGVYETTNYATFSAWSWKTVIVDTLWGGLLFALVTAAVRLIR